MRNVCLIILIAVVLGACGQKGSLYLPEKPAQSQSEEEENRK
ncbi:MAG TPA: lipoprotein [Burkholderiales bacterium]|nr:lipoprotein [Burkholderiales bacterium]